MDKTLSPMQARTERQLLSLRTDNAEAGDFWLLTDGVNVALREQPYGEGPRQSIDIPRAEFNRLVRWYIRQQKCQEQPDG